MKQLWAALTGNRRVNVKAFLILIVTAVVLGGTVYFVHGWQVRRNAHVLLEEADRAEHEGQSEAALEHLENYLGLEPHDTDARAKYGLLLAKLAKTRHEVERAFLTLEDVVRRDGKRQDARHEAARLGLRLGRFAEAKAHLEKLLTATPDDLDLLHELGRAEAGLHNYKTAAELYGKVMKLAPKRTDFALEYAGLLRVGQKIPELGDQIIEDMVLRDPRAQETRLKAAAYFRQFGQPNAAWVHLRFALTELGTPTADLLALAGEVALLRGDAKEAGKHFEEGRRRFPKDARMGQGLARLALAGGDRQKALSHLDLRSLPEDPDEQWALANLLLDAGALAEVRELSRRLEKAGRRSLVDLLETRLLMKEERWGDASKQLEKLRGTRLAPGLAKQVPLLQAECYERLANPDQRLAALSRALELDPFWPAARRAHAVALAAVGQFDRALTEYRKLADQFPEVRGELARLLLARTIRLPREQRDWSEVEKLVNQVNAGEKATLAARLLRIDFLAAREQWDEAQKLTEAMRDEDPRQTRPWLLLIGLAERRKQTEAIPKLVDEAERQAGKNIYWTLARASHALLLGRDRAKELLPKLLPAVEQFQGPERVNLLAGLARGFAAAGDAAQADRLWFQVAELEPDNLAVRFVLLEAALRDGRTDAVRRLVKQLRRIEGGDGALTAYGEAVLRLRLAVDGDRKALAEARPWLAKAAALRPSWRRCSWPRRPPSTWRARRTGRWRSTRRRWSAARSTCGHGNGACG